MNKTVRDHSVTISKAIAIILMVMGHSGCPENINHYLGLIRMPLFFFMSGYCFKESYLDKAKTYIQKRIKGIYWPFVKWSIFFLLMTPLFVHIQILPPNNNIPYIEYLFKIWNIIFSMKDSSMLLGGYWFLNSLFFGSLIFYFMRRTLRMNLLLQGMVLLVISILFNLLQKEIHVWNFNWLNFYAAFFIWSGNYYKIKQWNFHKKWIYICIIGIAIAIINIFWYSRMTDCPYWGMPIYTICAISGTLMIFGLSNHLIHIKSLCIKLLIYIGGYTFNILTWHFLSMKIVSLVIIVIYRLPYSKVCEFPFIKEYADAGWWIVYLLIGTLLPIGGTYIYHLIIQKYNFLFPLKNYK